MKLESLVNAEEANIATWLNGHGFSNVQLGGYWSSTTHAYITKTNYAWVVSMVDGSVGNRYKANIFYVWPVRGGQ